MVGNSDPRVPFQVLEEIATELRCMGFKTFRYASRAHISRACKLIRSKKYAERFNQIYIRLNRCRNPNACPDSVFRRVKYRSTMISIAWNTLRDRMGCKRRSIPSTSTIFKILFLMEGYKLPYFQFLKNKRKHKEALSLLYSCIEYIKSINMRLEENVELLCWDWPFKEIPDCIT
jgi:hypothetical protein